MRVIKYVPKACEGDDATFEGFVMMKTLSFDDKYELFENSNVANLKESVEKTTTSDQMKMIRTMVKNSEKFYESVSLRKKSTGEEFKSFEDLKYDDDAHIVLIDIATALLNGFKLGK